jgi:hypothetical protein
LRGTRFAAKRYFMKMRINRSNLGNASGLLLIGLIAPELIAAEPPARIELNKLPSQSKLIDEVVVPVPSEIFSVLDKLGSPNWHSVLRSTDASPRGERPQLALQLGTVIAEGFIAVEAQDSEEVKTIGRSVLKLAKAIGVHESVVARSNSIIEAADQKKWMKVRGELDGALQDVKRAMIELQDDQLAQLVSLGGWLRGTEALTSVVKNNYTQDTAELLHQPVLLDYFERQLSAMKTELKNNDLVEKIQKRLPEMRPLITKPHGKIPEKSVEKIHEITADLVKSVSAKAS